MRCGAVRHAWNSSRRDHERSTHRDRTVVHTLRCRIAPAKWAVSIHCSEKSLVQKKKGLWARQRQGETTGGLFDSETRTGRAMDPSISLHQNPNASAIGAPPPEALRRPLPAVKFSPAEIVRHRTAHWRGVQAKTVQIISHEHFEYSFKQQCHLLVAVEQGVRYDGETFVEGLPKSTIRNYSHKLIFVPAGRRFFGAQKPRLLTRSISLYIDPYTVLVDPNLRFAETDLQPRSNAQMPYWQIRAHRLPRSRSRSDSAQRVRSAPRFIGSRVRRRRTIVAASSDSGRFHLRSPSACPINQPKRIP
jgi:hypothetical protein